MTNWVQLVVSLYSQAKEEWPGMTQPVDLSLRIVVCNATMYYLGFFWTSVFSPWTVLLQKHDYFKVVRNKWVFIQKLKAAKSYSLVIVTIYTALFE